LCMLLLSVIYDGSVSMSADGKRERCKNLGVAVFAIADGAYVSLAV